MGVGCCFGGLGKCRGVVTMEEVNFGNEDLCMAELVGLWGLLLMRVSVRSMPRQFCIYTAMINEY